MANISPHDSFGNRRRFPDSLPCRPSMDWALNRLSRTETLPDSKSPRQKGGGVLAIASRDARAVYGDP